MVCPLHLPWFHFFLLLYPLCHQERLPVILCWKHLMQHPKALYQGKPHIMFLYRESLICIVYHLTSGAHFMAFNFHIHWYCSESTYNPSRPTVSPTDWYIPHFQPMDIRLHFIKCTGQYWNNNEVSPANACPRFHRVVIPQLFTCSFWRWLPMVSFFKVENDMIELYFEKLSWIAITQAHAHPMNFTR